jgi:putative heme-binding domain-containing protein
MSDQPTSLRIESLRSLATLDPKAARTAAGSLLNAKSHDLARVAVEVLGQDAGGAKDLARRLLTKKLPRDWLPEVTAALRKFTDRDAEAARLLAEVMKGGLAISPDDKAAVERIRKLVAGRGSPQRGKQLYLTHKGLACIRCHRLEGVGGEVGPDLTRIWETHTVEKLIEAIVEPSKEIKEGYQTYRAETVKGQVILGLKRSQTKDEVVLRDSNGVDFRIALKDLDSLAPIKTSLMPDDGVKLLTFDEFIDLIAFLRDRRAQESLRGMALEFSVVGPFGGELKKAYPPEKDPSLTATYRGPSGKKLNWQPLQAEANGLLNLRAVFHKDHMAAYALTHVYSPREQKVSLRTGSDGPLRVWLNGKVVQEITMPRSAVPDADKVAVTLGKGWNTLLIKVVNKGGGHGLYLRFAGGEGLRIARQAEGK